MGCPPVRNIIHSLKLVDYLHVQADNQSSWIISTYRRTTHGITITYMPRALIFHICIPCGKYQVSGMLAGKIENTCVFFKYNRGDLAFQAILRIFFLFFLSRFTLVISEESLGKTSTSG